MEVVGTCWSCDRRGVLRGGTRRVGCVRVCCVPDERRPPLRDEAGRFVLHWARPRQLGHWQRAVCLATFSRGRTLRTAKAGKIHPLNRAKFEIVISLALARVFGGPC